MEKDSYARFLRSDTYMQLAQDYGANSWIRSY